MTLPPLGEAERLAETRDSWHAVAEHVLASVRYHAEGRIGLEVSPGGFSTPAVDDRSLGDLVVRVSGATLVVERAGETTTSPITTLRAAGDAVGIAPGAPAEVYTPSTPLLLDAPLPIDTEAAAALAAWFDLGASALETIRSDADPADAPSTPTLWPEHFDVGLDLGDEAHGGRGTFGASPGDAQHPEPYIYVTHWSEVPDDAFWNDAGFGGASRSYAEIAATPDAADAMHEFFAQGRALLRAAASS